MDMFLPDEFKGDVARFINSTTGQVWFRVARQRLPLKPALTNKLNKVALEYAYRDGAEEMLETLQQLATEENPQAKREVEKPLLNKEISELTVNDRESLLTNPLD